MPTPKILAGFINSSSSDPNSYYTTCIDVTDYGTDIKDYARVITITDTVTSEVIRTFTLDKSTFTANLQTPIDNPIEVKLSITTNSVEQIDTVVLDLPNGLINLDFAYPLTDANSSGTFTTAKGGVDPNFTYSITDAKVYPLSWYNTPTAIFTKANFDRYVVFGRIDTTTGQNGEIKLIGAAEFISSDTVTRDWFNEYSVRYHYVWQHKTTKQIILGLGAANTAPVSVIDPNDYAFSVWVGNGTNPLFDEDAAPDLADYNPGGGGNVPASSEPVSVDEAKAYMRIDADFTDDDTLIEDMIASARQELEKFTGLSFITKELNYYTEKLKFELPYGPVSEISYVKDANGLDVDYSQFGLDYPTLQVGTFGVNVLYSAGFIQLPKALKLAILKQVATDYEYRENFIEGSVNELSNDAINLAFKYSRNLFL
jgi:uncharacterized phiE125 gp8 family phage protein